MDIAGSSLTWALPRGRFPFGHVSLAAATWWAVVPTGLGLVAYGIVQLVQTPRIDSAPAFVMTAALTVLLELFPVMQGRRHNPQGVVMSTGFLFALMFVWGPWPAIMIGALGALCSDLRAGKETWKVFFNPAQYALTTFAAWMAIAPAFHPAALAAAQTSFNTMDIAWMVLGWAVWILVNFTLVAGVLASTEMSFHDNFLDDFRHETATTFGVLAISPLVVIVAAHFWLLLPLLMIPMVILYQTGQIATASEYAAGHDALTGLPNRVSLGFELERAVAEHQRTGVPFALMLLDLNDFKRVNDTLGHLVGDELLVRFAERLRSATHPRDCIARLGGDEFAMLIFGVDSGHAVETAERIHAEVSADVTIGSINLEVSMSLGIALCPEHGLDGTALLRRADVAMYSAKDRGRVVDTYSPERDENSADQLELVGQLRQALRDGDLELHYQPKLNAVNSAPIGFEALVRWRHPTRGYIAPDSFIPLAERSGVMLELTARVIELALEQALRWRSMGVELPIAVNVSPSDLVGTTLLTLVDAMLERFGVDPAILVFEITERMATHQFDEVRHSLDEFRARGVRISLDDFGTGYSSLLRLSALDVDEIKIDRAFVAAMAEGSGGVSIVRTIIELAHGRGMIAIAEGVENHEQWRVLAALGCDGIQGWHVARPMPAEQTTAWVESRLAQGPPAQLPPATDLTPVRTAPPGGPSVSRV